MPILFDAGGIGHWLFMASALSGRVVGGLRTPVDNKGHASQGSDVHGRRYIFTGVTGSIDSVHSLVMDGGREVAARSVRG